MGKMTGEEKTVSAMIRLFCRGHHKPKGAPAASRRGLAKGGGLCPACGELLEYAKARLNECPFGENKGPCSQCPVHCYKPQMRGRIVEVMRYSGPRMLLHHPVLAMRHLRSRRTIRKAKG